MSAGSEVISLYSFLISVIRVLFSVLISLAIGLYIFFMSYCFDYYNLFWVRKCHVSRFILLAHNCFSLKKAMAPHSSTLAWKIPWMEEPSGLQSMGSLTVGHDWATSFSLFTFMHWRRKWQPTPVFLPGESQGRGEPGGLPSMGSHRVGHDWSDLGAAAA